MRGLRIYRRRLPHWRLDGATYFVTWRLQRAQASLMPEERDEILDVLRHSDGQRFTLHAVVVMDDHVHLIVSLIGEERLEALVRNWKACGAARLRRSGRIAPFWQREYHDRIIRSPSELCVKIRYVAENPRRRWPGLRAYRWLYLKTP